MPSSWAVYWLKRLSLVSFLESVIKLSVLEPLPVMAFVRVNFLLLRNVRVDLAAQNSTSICLALSCVNRLRPGSFRPCTHARS